MTYRGHVRNGLITLDNAMPLREGAEVTVEFVDPTNASAREAADLASVLLRHAGKGEGLPADLAAQHDHYAHGKPKR
jgi:hypothetical protein